MKAHKSTLKRSAVVLVLLFSIFLLYTTLTGSEFPRAIYGPPHYDSSSAWQTFDSLNQNLVWHYWGYGSTTTLSNYLNLLGGYNMKSVLRDLQYWTPTHRPYLVENYSWGQWDRWEVEMDSAEALDSLYMNGSGWCFFQQLEGAERLLSFPPPACMTWRVRVDSNQAGTILKGPMFTSPNIRFAWRAPYFKFPRWSYADGDSQVFQFRIKALAQYSTIDTNTTVFRAILWHFEEGGTPNELPDPNESYDDSTAVDTLIVRVRDFSGSNQWNLFTIADTLRESLYGSRLDIFWPDSVDLWIDWVDYYDLDRGRFIAVDSLHNATLDSIVYECQAIENNPNYGGFVACWAQSDEPWRTQWRIHKYINNALFEHMRKSHAVQTVCK